MTARLDPAEKRSRRRERALKRLVDTMTDILDSHLAGLSILERERRLRAAKAVIAEIKERKRGH